MELGLAPQPATATPHEAGYSPPLVEPGITAATRYE
jgi:hypothetical protein